MRAMIQRSSVLVLLSLILLAGCGASTIHGTFSPQTVTGQPDRVHIVRAIGDWLTNGGRTPAPSPADVTSTDTVRVAQLYAHIRALPTYTVPPNAIFHCPAAFGRAETLITFQHGTATVLQVRLIEEGCVFVSVVGSPQGTYLRADDAFFQDLDALITNPA